MKGDWETDFQRAGLAVARGGFVDYFMGLTDFKDDEVEGKDDFGIKDAPKNI